MFELEAHDHSHCIDHVLSAAEAICQERGVRLTDQRKAVLEVLASSHVPSSAYDILDRINRIREDRGEAALAPVAIYRVLDFLMQNGIIHRIESRNAYVACSHQSSEHGDVTIFLLCDKCGRAGEFQSDSLSGLIETIAAKVQFQANAPVLEIRGTCAECREGVVELGDALPTS
ncbi:Fur family transcriptional regulator, zinc uptake regulator [Cohaesibacter sp. ES.047]|uniref:Fur family transcriptional regulator n=1 Tax=Cohaesibacter sp. ES.047 TaxID=1798205 RepID=UPI000BB7CB67|nr:Fur family transcriptional regulator [Cohaesibacter sp. ES.047]SNY90775.1 Fur family transcriptional regulator, zinc uptake regulator [Cohaesibacter sp. ES.047]